MHAGPEIDSIALAYQVRKNQGVGLGMGYLLVYYLG